MRWMESLVERAGAGGGFPTIQKLWSPDRYAALPAEEEQPGIRSYLLNRSLNFLLALIIMLVFWLPQ